MVTWTYIIVLTLLAYLCDINFFNSLNKRPPVRIDALETLKLSYIQLSALVGELSVAAMFGHAPADPSGTML